MHEFIVITCRLFQTEVLDGCLFCYFHFYSSHRRTRVKIEQTFGQLKRRFPSMSLGLRVGPQKACQIIKACCVLYNLSKEFREP